MKTQSVDKNNLTNTPPAMDVVRQNICMAIEQLDIQFLTDAATEVERRAKALSAVYKLTQIVDDQDEKQNSQIESETDENTHIPYDKIPPPNDAEMRVIQDRLNSIYTRLRRDTDPDISDGSLDP
ncbi:MAG: hypothetical protein COA43_09465 [Robiginitomaculum sp.]|nr:MAG: hypothetical protein COA43_09465 [Robiginitomaculum sp.]